VKPILYKRNFTVGRYRKAALLKRNWRPHRGGGGPHGEETDVADTTAPTITSSSSISLPEGDALSHTLTANESVTWTKTGGADQALFTLVGSTLSMTAKDYEIPEDSGSNNTYVVQVTATDSSLNEANQTITVTVTDVAEMSAEAAAFLARTSGLDATHTNAYIALIDDLVDDGIFAKLDFLQVYATQDQTTANLNLVSTSYTATTSGSPTWAADVGYTTASDKYVNTGFNLSTGTQFTQDSAHISVWSGSAGGSDYAIFASNDDAGSQFVHLRHFTNTNEAALKLNDNDFGTVIANATGTGLFVANRTSSTIKQIWRAGSQIVGDITRASLAPPNVNLLTGGNAATSGNAYAGIIRSLGAGSELTPTEIGNLNTRMAAFMTAVGASP
jgi:hypothetical protein